MTSLRELLYGVPILDSIGIMDITIGDVYFDSRQIKHQDLFVAIKGNLTDGHQYIAQAIEAGAVAVVCEVLPKDLPKGVSFIQVRSSSKALAIIAANFYDNPSRELTLIGVTGTNGKTTVASLLFGLYRQMGRRCGLLSTVQVRINEKRYEATHTTPDPLQINQYLREMLREGCRYAFMEVSSHALDQNRTDALDFDGAVFTNLSRDHLDYHGSFENYRNAKKRLFDPLKKDAFALLNADDKQSSHMKAHTRARCYNYALKSPADFKVKILEQQMNGMLLHINQQEIWTPLLGDFNAYNLTAVYGVAQLLGEPLLETATAISTLRAVEGRFQQVKSPQGVTAIVDYAHTPDALENVLQTIHRMRSRAESLITVVGCGGNRDQGKRPIMAQIATRLSDKVIFTADNPRNEDPQSIIDDMINGVEMQWQHKYLSVPNRREAIKTAIMMAQPGDLILVAGKGHEKYQEINGVKQPFDDRALIEEIFKTQNQS